jgi:hypothetical protein
LWICASITPLQPCTAGPLLPESSSPANKSRQPASAARACPVATLVAPAGQNPGAGVRGSQAVYEGHKAHGANNRPRLTSKQPDSGRQPSGF